MTRKERPRDTHRISHSDEPAQRSSQGNQYKTKLFRAILVCINNKVLLTVKLLAKMQPRKQY